MTLLLKQHSSSECSGNRIRCTTRKRDAKAIHVNVAIFSAIVWICMITFTPFRISAFSTRLPLTSHRKNSCAITTKDRPLLLLMSHRSVNLGQFSSSLISPTDMWGNIAVLSAVSSVALTLGSKTAIGRLLGPPVSGMALSFLLASCGVLPKGGSPGATSLQSLSVSLATPLILLGADLGTSSDNHDKKSLLRTMVISFAFAAASTWIAACVGATTCRKSLISGGDGLKLAAALLAKNIGGGINYVAVCQTLQVSPSSIAAGLCIDNIMALIYFPLTSILASGRPDVVTNNGTLLPSTVDASTNDSITVSSASVALSVATIATWLGNKIAGPTASIPCATALTLLFAFLMPSHVVKFVRPSAGLLGTVLLYLFFATAGAPGMSIATSVHSSFLLSITTFLCILYSIHGALLVLCRMLVLKWRQRSKEGNVGLDEGFVSPQRLLVASSAAIGGPATAAALAQANGWTSLVVPSMLVGNIGYAIATFLGLAFHAMFKGRI